MLVTFDGEATSTNEAAVVVRLTAYPTWSITHYQKGLRKPTLIQLSDAHPLTWRAHRFEDEAKALHYYQESHRVFPVNMDVISWLGAFHVKNEVYEKAVPYFELAARVQPSEVKWSLMVASCYRRIEAYSQVGGCSNELDILALFFI